MIALNLISNIFNNSSDFSLKLLKSLKSFNDFIFGRHTQPVVFYLQLVAMVQLKISQA